MSKKIGMMTGAASGDWRSGSRVGRRVGVKLDVALGFDVMTVFKSEVAWTSPF